ncbi:hypothetical protein G4G27_15220 [Sphingomonas sp. So64.6b]|uniref:hypothetical protein n=1 Tax=Sphingomonas sp. So64.6b TaxID=2997354 RepID=UPI0015FF7F5A|nr:hypothetical protein [Sphingomonas sp. So64.6b]QNA85199.1 hypothetical protein G4G27_15220 [Sphingomonas sp. So64.6b]
MTLTVPFSIGASEAIPGPEQLDRIVQAAADSDIATLQAILGPDIELYTPRALGKSYNRKIVVKEIPTMVAKCTAKNSHNADGFGHIDWTCGERPTEVSDCGPLSYRLMNGLTRDDKIDFFIIAQEIMAPAPCAKWRPWAAFGLRVDEDPRHLVAWPNPVRDVSSPTDENRSAAMNFAKQLIGVRKPNDYINSIKYTIFTNVKADWLDGSTNKFDSSYHDFARLLYRCKLKDVIGLSKARYLGDSDPFGASFVCHDRGNNYPLALMSFTAEHGNITHSYLYYDQPIFVYPARGTGPAD